MNLRSVLLASFPALVSTVVAQPVQVTITGTVSYNAIRSGELAAVHAGDPASISMTLDSGSFTNGLFPTRGYTIDPASFTCVMGSVNVDLASPFPVDQTPYFSLRNNDPVADGFLLTTDPDYPMGIPTNQPARFGPFHLHFLVTYGGEMLDSLNLEEAAGTYGYDGLSVFGWSLMDGEAEPLGIDFEQMVITVLCRADFDGDGFVTGLDFDAFVDDFEAGELASDFDGDGFVTGLDFDAYVAAFEAGC